MIHKKQLHRAGLGVLLIAAAMLPASLCSQKAQVVRKVEFENELVRVERLLIPPHDAGAMHTHTLPSLEVFLTEDHIREVLQDGTHREWRAKAGEVAWFGEETHRVENLRDVPTEIISIQFKSLPPAAMKNSANPSVEEFENDWIKVTHGRIAAHAISPSHSHPQYIGILLTDTKVRLHLADGSTRDLTGKRGEVSWRAPVTHRVENLAGAPFEAIDVNLKTPVSTPKN